MLQARGSGTAASQTFTRGPGFYWGYIGIVEKKMETTIVHWGNIGIMEKKMETTIVYWGNIGIMERNIGVI